ncbi:MAG: rane protein [Mycobacterium sp.]|nr:rane protein [Mycobacterium sp.]
MLHSTSCLNARLRRACEVAYRGCVRTRITRTNIGLFFTMFCFVGVVILVPLWIWTFVDAIMMFTGGVKDSYGRKLQ